ncbi:MAG: U32 family peptidase [Candidatus Gastranaerophilales bacterium]|nr:U32 family peptidase [Candidatus Gastranaerophilales bacterium]
MKDIKVLFPILTPKDIKICEKSESNLIYVSFSHFLTNGFEKLFEFIEAAKKYKAELFIYFEENLFDKNNPYIKDFLKFIDNQPISGIIISTLAILEFIKLKDIHYKIIIDSSADVHNLSSIEFMKLFQKIDYINVSEEIYMKNIAKIKKSTRIKLCIDSNNLPWIAEDILKLNAIELIMLKGDFSNAREIAGALNLVEKIIQNPKVYKNKKLPFKTLATGTYETNHFTGEFLSTKGKDFKFSGNIEPFDWHFHRIQLSKSFDKTKNYPKLCLRMNSLEQLRKLQKYIDKLGFNPVQSMEYGEILNTVDLSKNSFNQILTKVKAFCAKNNIKLKLSTPKTLIERDIDRVYEYVKALFDNNPPYSLIINNLGFWWMVINDPDYDKLPIELGPNLNLNNGESILSLANQRKIEGIELSNFVDVKDIEECIRTIKDDVPNKKLTIAGSIKIPCSGLCPLNHDSAVLSRLTCPAPCQKRRFAITDKDRSKTYTLIVDGFCRMHLYRDKILDLFQYVRPLLKIGINEFIIDFSALTSKLVPVLITRYLNSLAEENYQTDEHFLDKLYYLNYYY